MFKRPHWFGHWTSKPRNPLSLDHLRYLCNVMSKNSVVTEQNKTLLVETLRQIAEILIWGDQNDSTVFDFFLERNMLSFFLDIMKQKCGNYVTVQLLQTLNILFENIRHETSLYYLLSNNHVNSIILHKFDLSDEEVMAYYISYLKTLSFKLNSHTIHFFFNGSDFPLYTEAIKYFNHPEKMVRIAVRILTLNVFKVEEKSMLKFITGQTVPCLSDLVHFIRENVINIEKCLKDNSITLTNDKQMLKIDDLFAEHLDHLHYLNDILMLKIDDINRILSDNLMHHLVKPLIDAYKDDPNNSMIRLFTLEFTTSILSKVLAISLYDEIPDDVDEEEENTNNINQVVMKSANADEDRDRLINDVRDCNDKQDFANDKLSGLQMAIIEQSKEIAELKVKTLLQTDTRQQTTYLGLFDTEYNEMRRKRLSIDYLLMDSPASLTSNSKLQMMSTVRNSKSATNIKASKRDQSKKKQSQENPQQDTEQQQQQLTDIDKARYMIRDFLLWRQLLLNIRNEKDRELSLKNTSWLSYAKLIRWLE